MVVTAFMRFLTREFEDRLNADLMNRDTTRNISRAATMELSIEIIAHRGASHVAPENTRAAIERAWQEAADAVEIDCRLTRDNEVVVIHDPTLQRTANDPRRIDQLTVHEVCAADVGRWKGAAWEGQHVPTLSEVLQNIPAGKRLFIEVKSGSETTEPLIAAITSSPASAERLVVISYRLDVLWGVKQRLPQVCCFLVARFHRDKATGEVVPRITDLIRQAKSVGLDGLNLKEDGPLEAGTRRQLADAGLAFYVWTVDSVRRARQLIDLGVDGIATNRPGALRRQLEAVDGDR